MVKINPNTAIFDLYVMRYYGIRCIEDKTTGWTNNPNQRKVKGDFMTRKEITTITNEIMTEVNNYNLCKRIILGLTNGNSDIAKATCLNCIIRFETLSKVLRLCGDNVIFKYDISMLIFRIDIIHKDNISTYKANSKYKFTL